MSDKEIWRPIVGYEGLYEVSNWGRVRSVDRVDGLGRKKNGKILKPFMTSEGYIKIDFFKGAHKKFFVHRLVADAFIPKIKGMECVNHIDGDKSNNTVGNLEWVSHLENTKHALKNGLLRFKSGEKNGRAKLTNEQVKYIRQKFIPFSREYGVQALSRKYNASHSTIYDIIHNKSYKE